MASSNAVAADSKTSAVYVAVDLGRSTVSSKVVEESGDVVSSLAIGYALNRLVSVEAYASSLSFRLLDGLVGDHNYYPSSHVGLAVVGYAPLADQWRLFARLGAGRTTMHADMVNGSSYSRSDATLGAGLAYDMTNSWSVRLSATRYLQSKATTALLGLEYRF